MAWRCRDVARLEEQLTGAGPQEAGLGSGLHQGLRVRGERRAAWQCHLASSELLLWLRPPQNRSSGEPLPGHRPSWDQ